VETYYLSQLVGKPVLGPQGRPVGQLDDIVVPLGGHYPPVTGLVIRIGSLGRVAGPRSTFLHWREVASVSRVGVSLLPSTRLDLMAFRRRPGELRLRADLLDQQVMDVHGRKLVRVNDVQLVASDAGGLDLRLAGIDVGLRGLIRRLDADRLAEWLTRRTRVHVSDRVIPWEYIEPVDLTGAPDEGPAAAGGVGGVGESDAAPVGAFGLQVAYEKLSALHPADVAELVAQLSAPDRASVLESLEAGHAADTLGELDPDIQGGVLEDLPTDAAVDILAELPPDEAADALAEVSEERAHELLSGLDAEDAAAVRQLMAYPEDDAGGMMTTDYVALEGHLTAQKTIDELRRLAPPAEEIYYVYVIDSLGVLTGVLSLRDLIVAPPDTEISGVALSVSAGNVVHVPVDLPMDEVVRVFDKYNLLALPVTDEAGRLVGVVTVDDALAAVLPQEERRRPQGLRR
jgi:magnesium transporter